MTAFSDEQYRFVVERLAEGDMPADVAVQVNTEWPASRFTARDVAALAYDKLNPDWQAYFVACREAFKAGAPTSDVAFRVALLDKMARTAASRNALDLARSLIELIEKIQSGFFAGKAVAAVPVGVTDEVTAITRTVVDPVVNGDTNAGNTDAARVSAPAPTEAV